jgi:hypothetical protein
MLRLLGFVFLVILCVDTAPWGLAIGALLCVAWLFLTPPSLTGVQGTGIFKPSTGAADRKFRSAIPLVHAVYCPNCDAITDSPHDACSSCGSRSVIAVSRLWHVTVAHASAGAGKYKISFTADVREIPATALSDTINLIASLAELGGDLEAFHIQVDSAEIADKTADGRKIELVKPVTRSADVWDGVHRQAS